MNVFETWAGPLFIQKGGDCLTPRGATGACADLQLCPYLFDMLVYNRSAPSDQYLRNSICEKPQGYNVKVCCDRPACVTDDGRAGACVETRACGAVSAPLGRGSCRAGRVCCARHSADGYVSRLTGLPEFGMCGVSEGRDKSAGGGTTSVGELPWSALLVYLNGAGAGGGEAEMCGGALISARFVITAAHCVQQQQPVKVRLGVHNITERCADVRSGCPFVTSVANVSVLPSYDSTTGENDIAIVTLADAAPYTKHIRPICLPERCEPPARVDRLLTGGWGVSREPGGVVGVRQISGELPLRSHRVCRGALYTWAQLLKPHLTLDTGVPESSICAGGTFRSELCAQDSGGALYHAGATGRATLVAVHSRSAAGCRAPIPAVYTPVRPHLQWIGDVLRQHYWGGSLKTKLVF